MTHTTPFLSLIIPVYRVEAYLRECLDSISRSPLDCWEAVLVDDGSPDRCPQICDKYAARDGRFRVIHQENAGVAAARNAGLDVARGDWAWFVDSDDVVEMRHVGEMMEWLKRHEEVDLVMFDLDTFKDGERIPSHDEGLIVEDEHLSKNEFLLKHICFHHPRLWYHRRGWWNCPPSTSAVPQRGGSETEHSEPLNRPRGHRSTDLEDIGAPTSRTSVEEYKNDGTKGFSGADFMPVRFTRGIRLAEDLEFQYKYLTLCQHPVKFDTTLYHYRLREGSATQDETYRARVVEDLPVVLNNLLRWSQERNLQAEPWYDYRIMKLMQNLLYSASLVKHLYTNALQGQVRKMVADYRQLGFPFTQNKKIRLAERSVKAYFLFNRIYLTIKGWTQ